MEKNLITELAGIKKLMGIKENAEIEGYRREPTYMSAQDFEGLDERNPTPELTEDVKYPVYNNSYGETIDAINAYAESLGYELDEDEFLNRYMDAFFKPKEGETKRDSLTLFKDGVEQDVKLNAQIYNRGNDKFELNIYIN